MALVLSLKDGEDFFVGAHQFVVSQITPEAFALERTSDRKHFLITEKKMVEVLNEVKISCGRNNQDRVAKVVIEAPKRIIIMRGEKMRQPRK